MVNLTLSYMFSVLLGGVQKKTHLNHLRDGKLT